ncbi:MAG: hypothetical protein KAJ86_07150 [Alphaproteobacteria bacterium]|nr:hypothetical protein [Alphaproteobacteria bacterium]
MASSLEELKKNSERNFVLLRLRVINCSNDDNELIDGLVHLVTGFIQDQKNNISQELKALEAKIDLDKGEECRRDHLQEDEIYFLESLEDLLYELGLLALHKKIEISTKKALMFVDSNATSHNTFKHDQFKKRTKDLGVTTLNIDGYHVANEIRLIGNSIKHSSIVSEELAEIPNSTWTKGKQLENLKEAYDRLAPEGTRFIKKYIEALTMQVDRIFPKQL